MPSRGHIMNIHTPLLEPAGPDATAGIVKLAILAVGGQGGGVITNWIVDLAEAQGWYAQATSVAGVAQRTGATIYYVEMVRQAEGGRVPVLSLSPSAGDVDIVLAAELMEAGRAIQRGFVTPNRTTLVASSHRALAVGEKEVPGNGILDPTPILEAARQSSQRFLSADLETAAVANGSVISASLFGALAGAEALPFPREAFEETIRRSGKGVEASLRAFRRRCRSGDRRGARRAHRDHRGGRAGADAERSPSAARPCAGHRGRGLSRATRIPHRARRGAARLCGPDPAHRRRAAGAGTGTGAGRLAQSR